RVGVGLLGDNHRDAVDRRVVRRAVAHLARGPGVADHDLRDVPDLDGTLRRGADDVLFQVLGRRGEAAGTHREGLAVDVDVAAGRVDVLALDGSGELGQGQAERLELVVSACTWICRWKPPET